MRAWPLAREDFKLAILSRELPQGSVRLMKIVPTALAYASLIQLKFVANLVYISTAESSWT